MSRSSSSSGKTVSAKLMYMFDDGTRPWLYARARTYQDKHKTDYGGRQHLVKVNIANGRDNAKLRLDTCGFQLIENYPTSLTTKEFYNDSKKVESDYYKEISDLICQQTGASYVHCFHHGTRNASKNQKKEQRYATDVHTDSSPSDGDLTYWDSLETMRKNGIDTIPYQKGRYLYINAWRNISDTNLVQDNHLAVLDERSTIKPDDYIPYDFYQDGYSGTNYYLSSRNSSRHKWFYFDRMAQSDVLLFKQYDSDPTKTARMCFHASFHDDTANNPPSRESIEVRCIAFFPDHTPNTCPEPSLDTEAKLQVSELLLSLDNMSEYWPYMAKQWFYGCMKKGDEEGWKQVLDELLKDKDNTYGLKKASKELVSRIRALAIQEDFESHCDQAYLRHLNK